MNIGIDVDDTLIYELDIGYAFGQLYGLDKKQCLEVKNSKGLYLSDIFNWSTEFEIEFFKDKFIKVLSNTPPVPLASEVITRLKNEGHTIHIITARHEGFFPNSYEETKNWLDKFNIPYDYLHVEVKDKGTKCKELGVDVLIDDIETNCLAALENGVKPYMYHTICNEDFSHKDITRVYSWVDIYHRITGKKFEI